MNITKLPSGSYRLRKTINGKNISLTVDHKPTKKEAEELIAEKANITEKKKGQSFFDVAYDYIEIKRNVLSPSTIRGYKSLLQSAYREEFLKKDINLITVADIQKEVNIYSANHSPKTVRNMCAFITSIFGIYRPSMQIYVTLPQKVKKEPYIPTEDDIKRIFEEAKNTKWEVALKLLCLGLRRSELCALSIDDLTQDKDDRFYITINKALVLDEYNKFVIKTTKTTESTRTILVPSDLAELIRKQGYIFDGYPNTIYYYLQRTQDKLNIPRFSLHKLRHYFASYAHSIGIPDAYIMNAGGWRTDNVLKQTYRHAMIDKNTEMQQKIIDNMQKLY